MNSDLKVILKLNTLKIRSLKDIFSSNPGFFLEVKVDEGQPTVTDAQQKWSLSWNPDIVFNCASVNSKIRIRLKTLNNEVRNASNEVCGCTLSLKSMLDKANGELNNTYMAVVLKKSEWIQTLLEGRESSESELTLKFNITLNSAAAVQSVTTPPALLPRAQPSVTVRNQNGNSDVQPDVPIDQNPTKFKPRNRLAIPHNSVALSRSPSPSSTASPITPSAVPSTSTPIPTSTASATTSLQSANNNISELDVTEASVFLDENNERLPPFFQMKRTPDNVVYYYDNLSGSSQLNRPQDLLTGWERRADQKKRVYYVDHNTRSTTWQCPNPAMLDNVIHYERWRNERSNIIESTINQLYDDDDNRPLPLGWERRVDDIRRPYYVNHENKTTQWEDPRLERPPLPEGWELRYTKDARPFYINHTTKTTTFIDPRIRIGMGNYDFKTKTAIFRFHCLSNSLEGHVKINVTRKSLLADSYSQVMHTEPPHLRKRLYIVFKGEEGLDYGGVAREWFFRLSQELLNPMISLFEYACDNNYSLKINPASFVNPEHLEYFRFVGRLIAMALFHGKFIDSGFTLSFYKRMIGKKITLQDVEGVDYGFYNSCKFIQETNLNDCDLELFFTADYEILGEIQTCELIEDGKNVKVNESNKAHYLELMANWRINRGTENQTEAFLKGFNEVLPINWLSEFDEKEIELLLCGMQNIKIEDWERHTIYRHYTQNSKQIHWFWKYVHTLDYEMRVRLLQFVTGTCRLPVGGFKYLMGNMEPQKFCIEKVGKDSWLPRSHACFNRLDLPPYKSFNQLSEKMNYAIRETEGFSID